MFSSGQRVPGQHAAHDHTGIGSGIHYPVPVHRQPAYCVLGETARLSVTDKLSSEILSLPMYPQLGTATAERVVEDLRRSLAELD